MRKRVLVACSALLSAPVEEAATSIANVCGRTHGCVVGVTGPSCVGKSVFAAALVEASPADVAMLPVDSFLRPELRGDDQYLRGPDRPLTPNDFDFDALRDVIGALESGASVRIPRYRRGVGWDSVPTELKPGEYTLVEGLFLDSAAAEAASVRVDLGVRLESSPHAIEAWRLRRDEALRAAVPGWRSEDESRAEARRTLEADRRYERGHHHARWIRLILDVDRRILDVASSPGTIDESAVDEDSRQK